jgi:hypothetical protein
MSAGVSPVSPVVRGTPASRTAYEATPVSPSVQKATTTPAAELPGKYDPGTTEARPANDGLTGFSVYA